MPKNDKDSAHKTKQSQLEKIKNNNEQGGRRALIEELFNDLYKSRRNIYAMNFYRGIFFGFGSVLGGTLLVAIVVWILSQTSNIFPALDGFLDAVVQTMRAE